jgi:hypothetical protein
LPTIGTPFAILSGVLFTNQGDPMTPQEPQTRWGKIRYGLAAWLLGLPLPIIIIAFLWGGCGG